MHLFTKVFPEVGWHFIQAMCHIHIFIEFHFFFFQWPETLLLIISNKRGCSIWVFGWIRISHTSHHKEYSINRINRASVSVSVVVPSKPHANSKRFFFFFFHFYYFRKHEPIHKHIRIEINYSRMLQKLGCDLVVLFQ